MPGQKGSKNVSKAESADITEVVTNENANVEESISTLPTIAIAVDEPKVEESIVIAVDEPKVEVIPKRRYVKGEAFNCGILRVRKAANAKSEIVTVINRGTQVQVDLEQSSESFYKITVNKITGFCMKEFINILE